MPPLVHLDSQDYSKLSDPLALTAGLQEVKRRLSGYAERGEAIFISSSVLISEISPLDHNAVDHAKRRAELLGVFCGRKTFRSLDNLVKKELASYGGISINRDDLIPEDGEWFPDIGEIIYESDAKFDLWTKMKQELSEATNRHKRRAIKKMLMRKGLMREAPLTNLLHETNSIDMGGLRARYPMKEADLRTLILHKLGHRSRKEAESAFISSFQDPVWMIQWFRKCPMELNVIPEFCRKPARELCNSLSGAANSFVEMRVQARNQGIDLDNKLLTSDWWAGISNKILLGCAKILLQQYNSNFDGEPEMSILEESCPGLCTMIRSSLSSLWLSFSKQPRESTPNDFMDTIHSYHAPYVDIFRADRYMAQHILRQKTIGNTIVAPSLVDLPEIIEKFQ